MTTEEKRKMDAHVRQRGELWRFAMARVCHHRRTMEKFRAELRDREPTDYERGIMRWYGCVGWLLLIFFGNNWVWLGAWHLRAQVYELCREANVYRELWKEQRDWRRIRRVQEGP